MKYQWNNCLVKKKSYYVIGRFDFICNELSHLKIARVS